MPKFDLQANVDDTESFLETVENFNRDASHVEDRLAKLDKMDLEVKFSIDYQALDNGEEDFLTIRILSLIHI